MILLELGSQSVFVQLTHPDTVSGERGYLAMQSMSECGGRLTVRSEVQRILRLLLHG